MVEMTQEQKFTQIAYTFQFFEVYFYIACFLYPSNMSFPHNCRRKYDSVIGTLMSYIRDKGFKQVIKWDRVEGIDYSVSDEIAEVAIQSAQESGDDDYDLGDFDVSDSSIRSSFAVLSETIS